TMLEYNPGNPGPDTVVTIKVTSADYWVRVNDLSPTAASINKPFTLVIEKTGAGATKPEDGGPPLANPALFAFLFLGLGFLGIPLIFSAEKKRIPLRLDPMGVTMRNGYVLPWNEFQGTRDHVQRLRSGSTVQIGVELLFAR